MIMTSLTNNLDAQAVAMFSAHTGLHGLLVVAALLLQIKLTQEHHDRAETLPQVIKARSYT